MATWDKTKPAGTQELRLADDDIRDNFDALEDAIGRNHNFAGTYGDDAGEHTVVELQDQAGDETQEAGVVKLWNNAGDLKMVAPSGTARYLDAIPSGEIILFEKDTVVTGYTLQTNVDDVVPFISKGSAAGGETGGGAHSTGTWTQPNHTLTTSEIPSHRHYYSGTVALDGGSPGAAAYPMMDSQDLSDGTFYVNYEGGGGAHNHGSTWRPAARVFTRQARN